MKLIHLADLHIDKKVFGYSLAEEQRDALEQVLTAADDCDVDGVLIAGDVYDTAVPNVEAVGILNWFLDELHQRNLPVFMISGNHDSAPRLSFGSELMEPSGVHIAGGYSGNIPYWDLEKEGEVIRIHMMPFLKPAMIRAVHECACENWTDAAKTALAGTEMLEDGKNILVSHQFYAGGQHCDSEQTMAGNLDMIDASVLEPFDYAALGHLHNPQHVHKEQFRYPGTLLKFSASELGVQKSITIIDTAGETVGIETIPLRPKRDFVRLRGSYEELTSPEVRGKQNLDNYFYLVLTDSLEQIDVRDKLAQYYPRLLQVEYEHAMNIHGADLVAAQVKKMPWDEITAEFYEQQQGKALLPEMMDVLHQCWEEIHEAD